MVFTLSAESDPSAVDHLLTQADVAWRQWRRFPSAERARILREVATALDDNLEELILIAAEETHLPEARLRGEVTRTTFQVRLFAEMIEDGGYLDARVDHADAGWGMGPRPDLRRVLQPVGPVLVFTASNFPFAFSVMGGDSVSALAAGCSVIVKGHPGHPQLSSRTAELVIEALASAGAPDGVFSHILGQEAGKQALMDSRIRAASFTGSLEVGRALFDLACARTEPIPFYGELGSVNPVFVTKGADARSDEIVPGFITSFTLGSGQFCTKPGILLVPQGGEVSQSLSSESLPVVGELLNDRIAKGFRSSLHELRTSHVVAPLGHRSDDHSDLTASMFRTPAKDFLENFDDLTKERFGPTALVVEYQNSHELLDVAKRFPGQLTASVFGDEDEPVVTDLIEILSERVGRVLWNHWPTGVSVTYAQQHGGPYPATTAVGTTSVGTAAIFRFTRPIAFQNFPQSLLPESVRDSAGQLQLVDGVLRMPQPAPAE